MPPWMPRSCVVISKASVNAITADIDPTTGESVIVSPCANRTEDRG